MSKTIRTDEKLWNQIKKQIKNSNYGGEKGKWNARRSQLAVKIYKDMGGGYIGKKNPNNKLTKWTNEDWNYIDGDKKGRYLPKKVRDVLTEKQKLKENKLKRNKKGRNIPYTRETKKIMRKKNIF